MKISIIIPVYNEKKDIRKVIEEVKKIKLNKEIIIVDDYSKDGTRQILKKYNSFRSNKRDGAKNDKIKVLFHKKNCGKGRAIRTGLKEASGEIVAIQDADLELDPSDHKRIIKKMQTSGADVVYGSRFLGKVEGMHWLNRLANQFLTGLLNLLYGGDLTDINTAYKTFKRSVIEKLKLRCERFEFDPEVTLKVIKTGYKITEIPINYRARTKEQGKKICWRDGFESLWTIIKYRFTD